MNELRWARGTFGTTSCSCCGIMGYHMAAHYVSRNGGSWRGEPIVCRECLTSWTGPVRMRIDTMWREASSV